MNNNFSIRKKLIHYKNNKYNIFGGAEYKKTTDADDANNVVNVGEIVSDNNTAPHQDSSTIDFSASSASELQYMKPSEMTLYSIPQGTELYHGSKELESFDTTRINVGKDSLVAFFSPNKDFAMSYINSCASKDGFIHKFTVNKQIDKIYIVSPHDKNLNWNEQIIENNFCKGGEFGKMNGVGFFVKNDPSQNAYSSEFALCDPSQFLTYVGTFRCLGPRSLSDEYKFNKGE